MEVESPLQSQYDAAEDISAHQPAQALLKFQELLMAPEYQQSTDNEVIKIKENTIYRMAELYVKLGKADDLKRLMYDIRPFFNTIPKSRTAKIVRALIDHIATIPNTLDLQVELLNECITWCRNEKRTFLRQRIEARLAILLFQQQQFKAAIKLLDPLLREVKKLDDKLLLVELYLSESRVHLALLNVPRARASLTSARAASNAIYCPPLLQAQIDKQAGILCAEEKDYKTAYSYFFECFEGYNTLNDTAEATLCLKYMLLCKIMTNSVSDVFAIIHGKAGVKYAGIEVEAMRALTDAHKERSLKSFGVALDKYKTQLVEDPIIQSHINNLYENLLEQNLHAVVEPFSRVQIDHVAKLIDLPLNRIESKLSEMILDKKLNGILDQGAGDLIIFEDAPSESTFETSLSTIKELEGVVDKLYSRAKRLT